MDEISRSRGWDKEILHGVLPMEQPVLSDKWARKLHTTLLPILDIASCDGCVTFPLVYMGLLAVVIVVFPDHTILENCSPLYCLYKNHTDVGS